MTEPLVSMRGVGKRYSSREAAALSDVDLEVSEGVMHAIVGPSGSGKSTLLNVLGLLDRPSAGTYRLGGRDVNGMSDKERTRFRANSLGFVFQAHHLLPQLSVFENVALPLVHVRTPPRKRPELVEVALANVGLSHLVEASPAQLSGGERQRVAIARALVNRPALILCDEPTGSLDSTNSGAVVDLLLGLTATAGCSVVVVTHDDAVAARASVQTRILDGRATTC